MDYGASPAQTAHLIQALSCLLVFPMAELNNSHQEWPIRSKILFISLQKNFL